MYYRRVEIVDGETEEPVHFVGIHPIGWMNGDPKMIRPTAAFVECDEVEKLLRKIRGELALSPAHWDTYFFDDLIMEIDALLGDEAGDG